MILNSYPDKVTEEIKENQENLMDFFKQHKRNFFNKNNTHNPKFELRIKDGDLERFYDGLPKLNINILHRKTTTTSSKILIPVEKVFLLHYDPNLST